MNDNQDIDLTKTIISEHKLDKKYRLTIDKQIQNIINRSYMQSSLKQISGVPLVIDSLQQNQSMQLIRTPKSINQSNRSHNSFQQSKQLISSKQMQKDMNKQIKIIDFKDKQGQSINYSQRFKFSCCNEIENILCRWDIVNQFIFQIYSDNKQGQSGQKYRRLISVNFDTIKTNILFIEDNLYTRIRLIIGFHTLQISCYQVDNTKKLFKILEGIKNNCKGHLTSNILEKQQKFYQIRYETQQYFFDNCQTGDILLFQDNHFFAKVQRLFTNSDFDHIGMVIKCVKHGLLIFQANSSSGVSLFPWKCIISFKCYERIPRIVWRRLNGVNIDADFRNKIQKFVSQKLDLQYDISLRIITANVSYIRTNNQNTQNMQIKGNKKQQGYFCSQLIATLYKNLGLLTRDQSNPNYQPACKFLPKDFSQKSQRKLDNGFLSPEYQIYFDSNLLKMDYPTFFQQKK